jgi:26S proteasome regulatory subunit N12
MFPCRAVRRETGRSPLFPAIPSKSGTRLSHPPLSAASPQVLLDLKASPDYCKTVRMSNQTSDLPTLLHSLEKNFSSNLFASLPPLLTRAKILLSTQNLLTPSPDTPPQQIQLARTVFEIGAYTSIRLKDKNAFVTYIGYLQNFYSLGLGGEREPELTGLNLLRLLAENKIAEFHTQLEIIDATAKSVAESEPVKFARGLEEWIMEGAYNRVWKAGEGTGVNVYQKFFLDVLMDTIRLEC